ncbi:MULTISPECIES: hypothetical protein [unclassified Streptomyces]|uniref:hypothetical protein n=1 Tax=unclassified Streptomyces TaxID=2593676 RepID=UPI00114662B4|nr:MULTISPECIES: hypothetical protein [unclassified Streptomyces]MCM1974267.1 hypothetical protein [Streptomyces sp. G1]
MSTARRLSRSRAWLRAFVLLLALAVPAAPAGVPVVEVVEYDVLDAAVRPAAVRRVSSPAPAPAARPRPAPRPRTALPSPRPHTPPGQRSVILRC